MSKPRISVVVIAYNQEDLIGRALDSILQQIEYLYEVIVADDCSPDGTWEKVLTYQEQHPNMVKAYRNPQNLGIVGNFQFAMSKITGNLVYYCAGDDVLCDGLFSRALKRMESEDVDYDFDDFSIYCDFMFVHPNGKETVFRQDLIECHDGLSLKIRGLIFNRSLGYSRGVLSKIKFVTEDLGIHTDGLLDAQVQMYSKKNYYFKYIGSKYYTDIGISSVTDRYTNYRSLILMFRKLMSIAEMSPSDILWEKYQIAFYTFLIEKDLKSLMTYLLLYIRNLTPRFGWGLVKRESRTMLKSVSNFVLGKL